ncbi:MFS transporter [Desulfococcaceae bacterium HSG9]|nr:MFS transporter [Desulfococcaceae bacterium HSG9]
MNLNISVRIKIFFIAVCIIVSGQIFYSWQNIDDFQKSNLKTIKTKCLKSGEVLKEEIEYFLKLGISFEKLMKLEKLLQERLNNISELEFIEIIDTAGYALYYADRNSMIHAEPGKRRSSSSDEESNQNIIRLGFNLNEIDTTLSLFNVRTNKVEGHIKMRLSASNIVGKSREILLDMITVILTSLLITFELMTFFVTFSITTPMERVTNEVNHSVLSLSVFRAKFIMAGDLELMVIRFNNYMVKYLKIIGHFIPIQRFFPQFKKKLTADIQTHVEDIDSILSARPADSGILKQPSLKKALEEMRLKIDALQERVNIFAEHLSNDLFITKPDDVQLMAEDKKNKDFISTSYIRPFMFIFAMSTGFSVSFFPLFVNNIYQPMWGLGKDVIIGLPISFSMFFLAISMPLTGILSDRVGWYKPMIVGIFINAIAWVLTAMSKDIYQVLIFQSLMGIGSGAIFMSSQKFVIDNSDDTNRASNMASSSASFFSGNLCGIVVGGMLADRIGYENVFFLSGAISISAFIYGINIFGKNMCRIGKDIKKDTTEKNSDGSFLRASFQLIKDREFFAVVFLQAIPAKIAVIGFLFYLVPIYLKSIGTLQSNIGRVVMCYGILMAFLGPILSKLLKASHRKYNVFAGGMITGIAMISNHFFSGFTPILMIVIMLGIAQALSNSPMASYISEMAIVQKIGTGTSMGLFRFLERIGNVTGPVLVGFIIYKKGYEQSIVILGIISFVCSILYILMISMGKNKPKIAENANS